MYFRKKLDTTDNSILLGLFPISFSAPERIMTDISKMCEKFSFSSKCKTQKHQQHFHTLTFYAMILITVCFSSYQKIPGSQLDMPIS